jgi:tetratricopeptide (TPR) repeat protein
LEALKKYKDTYATGWEIVPCLTMSARLHEEQGDTAGALEVYEALLGIPDVPKDIRRDSEMNSAQMLLRVKSYQQAETKLKALSESLPSDDPQKAMVQVFMVQSQMAQGKFDQAEAALQATLQSTSDPRLKAAGHNLLGDYYRLKKPAQDEEALWQYLKVDTLYSQDKDEHAKALYFLSKLFETVQNNKARAQQCLEKLIDKGYASSEYHKKALEEKPPEK